MRDQDKRSEARRSGELQIPWSNHLKQRIKTRDSCRIAQTTAALSRLKITWRDKNILLASKVKLMRMLILSTFLYACESWTLTAEIERRIQALEMRCYRRLLNISYKDHVTNEEVRKRIQNATGVHDAMVKKRKLRWYGPKYECFLMTGCWDIPIRETLTQNLRNFCKRNGRTNGQTERQKLYTPRHKKHHFCRG